MKPSDFKSGIIATHCPNCDHPISWHHANPGVRNTRSCYGIGCQCTLRGVPEVLRAMRDIE